MGRDEIGISIISEFVQRYFKSTDIGKLWNGCPNRMLWEAIHADDATIITQDEVLKYIQQASKVYVLPEPLPAFYRNTQPAYAVVSSASFTSNFSEYSKIEPLYLISKDFSWMIAMTTENTPSGEQLCALMKSFQTK